MKVFVAIYKSFQLIIINMNCQVSCTYIHSRRSRLSSHDIRKSSQLKIETQALLLTPVQLKVSSPSTTCVQRRTVKIDFNNFATGDKGGHHKFQVNSYQSPEICKSHVKLNFEQALDNLFNIYHIKTFLILQKRE